MAPPHLGIFWFVRGHDRQVHVLAVACALAAADEYGDCLTSSAEHYKTWESWRRGRPVPPVPALAPIIAAHEYEQWPRGRVVYERPANRFVIYADQQLLGPQRLAQIRTLFHLPPQQTIVRTDLHYRSVHSLRYP